MLPRCYTRIWPSPCTIHFVVVSSVRPIGPRACSFWVDMPTSAPRPSSPPSVNRVEAFTMTAAESISAMNLSALARSLVRIASVCPVDQVRMCRTASSRLSTMATARSRSMYSVAQSSSEAGRERGPDPVVRVQRDTGFAQGGGDGREHGRAGVDQECLNGVADAGALGFGVEQDVDGHLLVCRGVNEDVHVAFAG